jgi:galactose mutarotase-like enzyme
MDGPVDADVLFDEGDMCGWDEMMPTIAPCRYPDSDIELADHGELWRQAWTVTTSDATSVTTVVHDEVLGYRLERTLRVVGSVLSVAYRATSEADVDRFLLWAAHPLFAHRPGTRVVLNGADVADHAEDGPIGLWPDEGVSLEDFAPGQSQKLFARLTSESASASLVDADGVQLIMRWGRSDASYLGIWLDNCSLSRHPVVALEPTNVSDDALDAALAAPNRGAPWCLRSGSSRNWRMDIELGGSVELRPDELRH